MTISVIIPTYNRPKMLLQTLQSLQEQRLSGFEILVVDNAASLEVAGMVAEFDQTAKVASRYVSEPRLGLHYARHTGARHAHNQILAFIDDDAIADPGWLEGLLDGFVNDEVGCVGGKILLLWEREPPIWVRTYGPGYLSGLDLGDRVLELKEPGIYGCNLAIRKSTLMQVGGFNPDSFGSIWLGDGETGLLRKVLLTSWKIIYTPKAVVSHVVPTSRMTLAYLKQRSANQGASSSYATYRQFRPSSARLLLSSIEQCAKGALLQMLSIGYKAFGNDRRYHCEIRASYYWRRSQNDLKLIYDRYLKGLVETDDWFSVM